MCGIKNKVVALSLFLLLSCSMTFAQLGIRAGVNMANEIHLFEDKGISSAFKSENLTGYQVGLVYQFNPERSGIGFEIGALLSQKGGVFRFDDSDVLNSFVKGYREINYIEMPLSLRGRIQFGGVLGIYGSAGIYGACALNGKTVFESNLGDIVRSNTFDEFMDRIDYGYSLGAGVELIKKLQIGFNWNQALQKKDADKSILDMINTESGNRVPNLKAKSNARAFAITLTYLF